MASFLLFNFEITSHCNAKCPSCFRTSLLNWNDKYQTIGRDPTSNIVFAKGKCINLSNQTTLGLKIRNKEKRLKSVKTELL